MPDRLIPKDAWGRRSKARTLNLSPVDLTALRDIHVGLAMFVPARQSDFLRAKGLVVRRPDGRVVLTGEGLSCIKGEQKSSTQ